MTAKTNDKNKNLPAPKLTEQMLNIERLKAKIDALGETATDQQCEKLAKWVISNITVANWAYADQLLSDMPKAKKLFNQHFGA